MKKIVVTSIALAMSVSVGAQSLDIANDRPVVASPTVVAQVTPAPFPMIVSTEMPTFREELETEEMPTFREELETEDVIIRAGIGTAAIASLATAAAPAVVAHSSGMAIMWSGTGYVAGTIGLGAATVAALPVIATVGAVTAGGAYAYKHRDAIAEKWNFYFGDE